MNFKEFYLDESINDKNLFKVIFLAGGPGSGKSFISKLAFGGEPLVYINQDSFTELILKKEDMPFVFDPSKKEIYSKQLDIMARARNLTSKKLVNYVNGMLPIVIDGTGRNFNKITNVKKALDNIGYDSYMIFVNTSLDVARARNQKRKRKVDDAFVSDAWRAVQDNIGKFQNEFGQGNFVVVDNSNVLDEIETKKLESMLTKIVRKFINEPLKNQTGRAILKKMKEKNATYISDISHTLKSNPERFSL